MQGDGTASRVDLQRLSARLDDAVATSLASGRTDRIELVLTDGYGAVLHLERVRRQARRQLDEILRSLVDDPRGVQEASALTAEIGEITSHIRQLRTLLETAARRVTAA